MVPHVLIEELAKLFGEIGTTMPITHIHEGISTDLPWTTQCTTERGAGDLAQAMAILVSGASALDACL